MGDANDTGKPTVPDPADAHTGNKAETSEQGPNDEAYRIEQLLQARSQELEALFKNVRDYAIFTIDTDGRISSWHEGAALMKGYTAEEAIGMPFANLFVEEDRRGGRPSYEMQVAADTGEYRGDGQRLRKNGERFDVDVVLTAMRGPMGELLGFLKLTQDITARKRADRERDETLRLAVTSRADAERAQRTMSQFLATISHELRTPLATILGTAQVLQRNLDRRADDKETLSRGLAAITRNARLQVSLIEDLLDMNRIESGDLQLDVQPVNLAAVASEAVEALLPTARAKSIHVQTVLDSTAAATLGDPVRLQQIVWNLLANAIKFTPPDGHVTVRLTQQGDTLEIGVEDTGQGIEPQFLSRVFERFQQQDGSSTRRHGGLGVGLAIVRQLAVLHGGSVRAESAGVGHGASFIVSLPTGPEPAMEPEALPRQAARRAQAEQRLDGLTLVLVDDDTDGREMTAHLLQSAGAQVLEGSNAVDGLALVRQHRPDVLVSDIGMPEHDGYDLISWIRALDDAEGATTPAIALTAFARPADQLRAVAAGFDLHLVKPVEPRALFEAVRTVRRGHVGPAGRAAGPQPLQ